MTSQEQSLSGLYLEKDTGHELRLDVDGRYPLLKASGTFNSMTQSLHWIADLRESGPLSWDGTITYKNPGDVNLPFSAVAITSCGFTDSEDRKVILRLSGEGNYISIKEFVYASSYFHTVDFEFDSAEGTEIITSFDVESFNIN